MKKFLSIVFCLAMAIASKAQTPTYDFSAVNNEGVTLYYKISDETNQKVFLFPNEGDPTYETLKKLIVPDKVTGTDGKEYTVTGIQAFSYNTPYPALEELILPKTLEHVNWQPLLGLDNLKKITMQGLKSHRGIFFQTDGVPFEEIRLMMVTIPENTFNMGGWHYPIFNTNISMEHTRVYVPTDCSYLYKTSDTWKINASDNKPIPYLEEVKIGPHGYTSYYLENENFEVPTGCTAYIVKGASLAGGVGNATVQAFAAGSIIPKQTGFILGGTANTTVAYRAHVTGSEVDVSGNLLVGTATENEFSGAGYKYYIFGNGSLGQGFYHQGTRDGNSIKVGAHRAGLRLPTSGYAPAKQLIFDFEEAKRNATTGISTVSSNTADGNTVYDLQGRRVQNPVKGIYVMNGKKIVFKK